MNRVLLLEKIIEADGNEFELQLENETFETLLEMKNDGMIRLRHFIAEGNSINLIADFLSATPKPQPSIGQEIIERTRKFVADGFDEMQEEIDRLNNIIVKLEKQLAER